MTNAFLLLVSAANFLEAAAPLAGFILLLVVSILRYRINKRPDCNRNQSPKRRISIYNNRGYNVMYGFIFFRRLRHLSIKYIHRTGFYDLQKRYKRCTSLRLITARQDQITFFTARTQTAW